MHPNCVGTVSLFVSTYTLSLITSLLANPMEPKWKTTKMEDDQPTSTEYFVKAQPTPNQYFVIAQPTPVVLCCPEKFRDFFYNAPAGRSFVGQINLNLRE